MGFTQESEICDVPIRGAITACDLPDNSTILLKVNKASLLGKTGSSLLSIAQTRESGTIVEEEPRCFGGFPHLEVDGVIIPLQYVGGLLTIKIRQPTGHELKNCNMVCLTSKDPWDPQDIQETDLSQHEYEEFCSNYEAELPRLLNAKWTIPRPKNLEKFAPYLLYPGKEAISKTLEATTQLGKLQNNIPLEPHLKEGTLS